MQYESNNFGEFVCGFGSANSVSVDTKPCWCFLWIVNHSGYIHQADFLIENKHEIIYLFFRHCQEVEYCPLLLNRAGMGPRWRASPVRLYLIWKEQQLQKQQGWASTSAHGVFIQQSPAEELMPEIFTFYKKSIVHKMNWYLSLGNQGLQIPVGKEVNQASCNFVSHRKNLFGFKTNLPPAIHFHSLFKTHVHISLRAIPSVIK